jgi:hypothetical protein
MAGMMGWPLERLFYSTLPELFFAFRGHIRGLGGDPDGVEGEAPLSRSEFNQLVEKYG